MSENERRICVVAHASALLGLVLPFGQVVGPFLVSWLAPRDAHEARSHASAAADFQLNMAGVVLVLVVLFLLMSASRSWFLLVPVNLYAFGMALVAAARAADGRAPGYPELLRIVPSHGGSDTSG